MLPLGGHVRLTNLAFGWNSSQVKSVKPPIFTLRTIRPPRAPEAGSDRLRQPSSPTVGLKPNEDGIRSASPFGSPKREGQHEQAGRNTGGVARSQVDPPQGGSGAGVHRHRRWQNHSPLRLPECMDGPEPPAALREVRLNGFPGAHAEVLRHRVGGARRRVPDAAPTGLFGAAKAGQPAHAVLNTAAWPRGTLRPPLNPRMLPPRPLATVVGAVVHPDHRGRDASGSGEARARVGVGTIPRPVSSPRSARRF